jgi:hypothetical protein
MSDTFFQELLARVKQGGRLTNSELRGAACQPLLALSVVNKLRSYAERPG